MRNLRAHALVAVCLQLAVVAVQASNSDYNDYGDYEDYDYDDLYDEFKEELDAHEHAFEEADDHGHHSKDIEKMAKKDYKDMSEEERLFYRFKEADFDDDDRLDGLELYHQIFKFRYNNFKDTQRRFQQMSDQHAQRKAEGTAKGDNSLENQLENNAKRLNDMRADLTEETIVKHADQSMEHLDADKDGIITWPEYRAVVGKYLDNKS